MSIKSDILAVGERYKNNWNGFWTEHFNLIILVILAGILDTISTIWFMERLGPEFELHPLVRYLSEELGIYAGPIIGKSIKIGLGLLVLVYCKPAVVRIILKLIIFLYTFACVYNFIMT